jgi:hypothetical protein
MHNVGAVSIVAWPTFQAQDLVIIWKIIIRVKHNQYRVRHLNTIILTLHEDKQRNIISPPWCI